MTGKEKKQDNFECIKKQLDKLNLTKIVSDFINKNNAHKQMFGEFKQWLV